MSTIMASDGAQLPLDLLAKTIVYTGENVTAIKVDYHNTFGTNKRYVQSFEYTGNNLTYISNWVPEDELFSRGNP